MRPALFRLAKPITPAALPWVPLETDELADEATEELALDELDEDFDEELAATLDAVLEDELVVVPA